MKEILKLGPQYCLKRLSLWKQSIWKCVLLNPHMDCKSAMNAFRCHSDLTVLTRGRKKHGRHWHKYKTLCIWTNPASKGFWPNMVHAWINKRVSHSHLYSVTRQAKNVFFLLSLLPLMSCIQYCIVALGQLLWCSPCSDGRLSAEVPLFPRRQCVGGWPTE